MPDGGPEWASPSANSAIDSAPVSIPAPDHSQLPVKKIMEIKGLSPEARLIFPGELIGTEEEFLPGRGVSMKEGKVYSNRLGNLVVDDAEMTAHIMPLGNVPSLPYPGCTVIGVIINLQDNMALVKLERIEGSPREISGDTKASIHVGQIDDQYVSSASKAFFQGDIIRGRVLDTKPSLKLSTVGKGFGVIHSKCHRCGDVLESRKDMLVCGRCELFFHSKTASDYGQWNF